MHAGRRLLGHALDRRGDLRPAARVLLGFGAQQLEDHAPLLGIVRLRRTPAPCRPSRTRRPCARAASRRRRRRGAGSGPLPSGHIERLLGAPPVLLERLALPREHRRCRAGSSTVPFGPTATAAAAWSCVEKMLHDTQRTSAPRSTSVSIRTAVCTVMCSEPMIFAPCERLLALVLGAERHEAGHLLLGEPDLLAAPLGERRGRATLKAGRSSAEGAVGLPSWSSREWVEDRVRAGKTRPTSVRSRASNQS